MIFFFKIRSVFCSVSNFSRPGIVFFVSSVGKIHISFKIFVVFQSRRFKKTFIDFSNNTFPIKTGIIDLFHYIFWGFDLFTKIINFNDPAET